METHPRVCACLVGRAWARGVGPHQGAHPRVWGWSVRVPLVVGSVVVVGVDVAGHVPVGFGGLADLFGFHRKDRGVVGRVLCGCSELGHDLEAAVHHGSPGAHHLQVGHGAVHLGLGFTDVADCGEKVCHHLGHGPGPRPGHGHVGALGVGALGCGGVVVFLGGLVVALPGWGVGFGFGGYCGAVLVPILTVLAVLAVFFVVFVPEHGGSFLGAGF